RIGSRPLRSELRWRRWVRARDCRSCAAWASVRSPSDSGRPWRSESRLPSSPSFSPEDPAVAATSTLRASGRPPSRDGRQMSAVRVVGASASTFLNRRTSGGGAVASTGPRRTRLRHCSGLRGLEGGACASGRKGLCWGMRIHLVDGTWELFRAHFGAPPHRDAEGREVGAVRGLLRSLHALVAREGVTHLACAFDSQIESFRNELFLSYKTSTGVPAELL